MIEFNDGTRPLTHREYEILEEAYGHYKSIESGDDPWFAPIEIGGYSRSDHSRILTRLGDERFNLINSKYRVCGVCTMTKPSCIYQITPGGIELIEADQWG